jgi:hypothetical protein
MAAAEWVEHHGRHVAVKPSRTNRYHRRQIVRIFREGAAHPSASAEIAAILNAAAAVIAAVDEPQHDPACRCYQGLAYRSRVFCPACSRWGR